MRPLKALLLFCMGAEAALGQNPQVTCSTQFGSLAVKYPATKTSTTTQTVTQTSKVTKKLDKTVTIKAVTTTLTKYRVALSTKTLGGTKTGTRTVTSTFTVTATNTISKTKTDTNTHITTLTTVFTQTAAPDVTRTTSQTQNGFLSKKRKAKRTDAVKPYQAQYPQRVDCIKTLVNTIVKTTTVTAKCSTVTVAPTTKTVTITKELPKVTNKYFPDVSKTITTTATATVTVTKDHTVTTTITTDYTVTTTAVVTENDVEIISTPTSTVESTTTSDSPACGYATMTATEKVSVGARIAGAIDTYVTSLDDCYDWCVSANGDSCIGGLVSAEQVDPSIFNGGEVDPQIKRCFLIRNRDSPSCKALEVNEFDGTLTEDGGWAYALAGDIIFSSPIGYIQTSPLGQ